MLAESKDFDGSNCRKYGNCLTVLSVHRAAFGGLWAQNYIYKLKKDYALIVTFQQRQKAACLRLAYGLLTIFLRSYEQLKTFQAGLLYNGQIGTSMNLCKDLVNRFEKIVPLSITTMEWVFGYFKFESGCILYVHISSNIS